MLNGHLNSIPPLSAEECKRLAEEGTPEAKDKLVRSILPMVTRMVHRTIKPHEDISEMFSSIMLRLAYGVNAYDGSVKFTTYAHYVIRSGIYAYRRNYIRDVHRRDDCPMLSLDEQFRVSYGECKAIPERLTYTKSHLAEMSLSEENEERRRIAKNIMRRTSPRTREIVRRHMAGETMGAIGESIGVTRSRIQQIIAKWIEQARESARRSLDSATLEN